MEDITQHIMLTEPNVGWDLYWTRVFVGADLIELVTLETKTEDLKWIRFETIWLE